MTATARRTSRPTRAARARPTRARSTRFRRLRRRPRAGASARTQPHSELMALALATGAEARWTGTPGRCAVVCVNGGTAAEVPGTWSASLEWLVRRLSARFPEPRVPRGAVPREVVAAPRPLRRGRRAPRSRPRARRERSELALLAFSMGGAVAVRNADRRRRPRRRRRQPVAAAGARARATRRTAARDRPRHARRTAAGDPGRQALDVAARLRARACARRRCAAARRPRRASTPSRSRRRDGGLVPLPGSRAVRRARRRGARALLRVGLYVAIRTVVRCSRALLYRIEIVGQVPPGPCVVAANHESCSIRRCSRSPRASRSASSRRWSSGADRPGAWLMDALGGIPIRRDRRRPRRGRQGGRAARRGGERSRSSRREPFAAASGREAPPGSRSRRASRSCRCGSSARRRALSRGRVGFPRIRIVVGEPIVVDRARSRRSPRRGS